MYSLVIKHSWVIDTTLGLMKKACLLYQNLEATKFLFFYGKNIIVDIYSKTPFYH